MRSISGPSSPTNQIGFLPLSLNVSFRRSYFQAELGHKLKQLMDHRHDDRCGRLPSFSVEKNTYNFYLVIEVPDHVYVFYAYRLYFADKDIHMIRYFYHKIEIIRVIFFPNSSHKKWGTAL